ncbi:MAG: tetratricopeptide repeat protein [Desulfobacteraceae bacterium]|nr:tetratricopeptide repeat protein [Desulfobacteraceae bacterium]
MATESPRSRNTQQEPEAYDSIQGYGKKILVRARLYQKQLIAAAAVFCVVLVVGAGVLYFLDRAEDNASAMLIQASQQYESMDKNADDAAFADIKQQFQTLIDEYGYTDAGKMAQLQYAGICYQTDDHDRALELYQRAHKAFKRNPHFSQLALNGMAYTQAAKGNDQEAISLFQQVVEDGSPALKAQALFQLGMLYSQTGNPQKSRQAYERLVSDFSDSIFAEPARSRISG